MPSKHRSMLGASGLATTEVAESVDFDGSTNYLSKASDFTANAAGKTFTLSVFCYRTSNAVSHIYSAYLGNMKFSVTISAAGLITIQGRNAAGTVILLATATVDLEDTFFNLLISIDLANASNRSVYLNDAAVTFTWTTYTNDSIAFNTTYHYIGENIDIAGKLKGRLAHFYLDYTYRDMSSSANRRLFITADLKPADAATLIALSPIAYFQMTDPDTVGVNSGTGGDMTVNGTFARSGRGPNQDNAVASFFDGIADKLVLTSGTSISSSAFTFSFNFQPDVNGTDRIFNVVEDASNAIDAYHTNSGQIVFLVREAGTYVLNARTPADTVIPEKMHCVQGSFDLTDTGKRHVFINGIDVTASMTWTNYTSGTAGLTTPTYQVGVQTGGASQFYDGALGEIYFHTEYRDLSASNPFWDSNDGRAVSIRKVIDDTGATPLVALPIIGNDAGNNLGSIGDFTVTSGPYTGARGASEYWAAGSDYQIASTSYLNYEGAMAGAVGSTTSFTLMIAIKRDTVTGTKNVVTCTNTAQSQFRNINVSTTTSGLLVEGYNSSGTKVLSVTAAAVITANVWSLFLISCDMTDTGKRFIYEANTALSPTWTTYNLTGTYDYSSSDLSHWFGSNQGGGVNMDGMIAEVYFTDTYLDISSAANRLLLMDALDYPRDVEQAVTDGDVTAPIIGFNFKDTAALGTNYGSGADYTEGTTVTVGADFSY